MTIHTNEKHHLSNRSVGARGWLARALRRAHTCVALALVVTLVMLGGPPVAHAQDTWLPNLPL